MKQGWEIKRLEDVVEFQRGLIYSKKDEVDFSDNVVLRSNNVDLFKNELDFTELKYINPAIDIPESKKVKKGSLLICTANGSKSHLGKVALIDDNYNYAFGGFMGLITPKQKLDSKFLFFLMTSENYKKFINELSDGANINNLKFGNLGKFEIPVPPLLEQQRIVSILDQTFAAIAKAKANAEQNIKNTIKLFESFLQGLFEKGNWEMKEFGEIITTLTDYHANGSYQILKKNVELKENEDFAWMVRSTDFENNFKNDFRFIDESAYNFLSKSKVFGGEIMMSKIGNAGNVYLMPRINRPCSLAMNLFLIRLNERKAAPEFVFQYLKSNSGEFQIKSRLQGATTKTITKDNVRNIMIPLPALNEQQTIIRQLEALQAETLKLEAIYQQKLLNLEELKKSILQKAFNGELKTDKVSEA